MGRSSSNVPFVVMPATRVQGNAFLGTGRVRALLLCMKVPYRGVALTENVVIDFSPPG